MSSVDSALHASSREIVALEQHRLASAAVQRVGKGVAEIQLGRVPASFSEIGVGLPSEVSLVFIEGLDLDLGGGQEIIKTSALLWTAPAVQRDPGLKQSCR